MYYLNVTKANPSRTALPVSLRSRIEYESCLNVKKKKLYITLKKGRYIFKYKNIYSKKLEVDISDIKSIGYKPGFTLSLPLITPSFLLIICLYLIAFMLRLAYASIYSGEWNGSRFLGAAVGILIAVGMSFLLLYMATITYVVIKVKKKPDKPSKILIPAYESFLISGENKKTVKALVKELQAVNPDIAVYCDM